MGRIVAENDLIPLTLVVHNADTTKTVKCQVYRDDTSSGFTLNAAEITLTHVTMGYYTDLSVTMPSAYVTAHYHILESDGSTGSLDTEEYVSESFQNPSSSLDASTVAQAVWDATLSNHVLDGTFGIKAQEQCIEDIEGLVSTSVTVYGFVDSSITSLGEVE